MAPRRIPSIPSSLAHPEPSAAPFLTVGPAAGISGSDSWGLANSPADACRRTEFVETKHERSLSLDTTVIDRQAEEMYFTKEEPKMGDHMHPMEGAILDFSVTRMRLIELFSRDGEICADERAALELFDDAKRTVSDLHNLDRAVETYKKQYRHGITRYGQRRWNLAGLAVEPYDPDAA